MDYAALRQNALWKELWDSDPVHKKVDALRNQLLNTSEVDAHTLGKLRGQLDALIWLRTLVDTLAEQQIQQASGVAPATDESVSRIAALRRFIVR